MSDIVASLSLATSKLTKHIANSLSTLLQVSLKLNKTDEDATSAQNLIRDIAHATNTMVLSIPCEDEGKTENGLIFDFLHTTALQTRENVLSCLVNAQKAVYAHVEPVNRKHLLDSSVAVISSCSHMYNISSLLCAQNRAFAEGMLSILHELHSTIQETDELIGRIVNVGGTFHVLQYRRNLQSRSKFLENVFVNSPVFQDSESLTPSEISTSMEKFSIRVSTFVKEIDSKMEKSPSFATALAEQTLEHIRHECFLLATKFLQSSHLYVKLDVAWILETLELEKDSLHEIESSLLAISKPKSVTIKGPELLEKSNGDRRKRGSSQKLKHDSDEILPEPASTPLASASKVFKLKKKIQSKDTPREAVQRVQSFFSSPKESSSAVKKKSSTEKELKRTNSRGGGATEVGSIVKRAETEIANPPVCLIATRQRSKTPPIRMPSYDSTQEAIITALELASLPRDDNYRPSDDSKSGGQPRFQYKKRKNKAKKKWSERDSSGKTDEVSTDSSVLDLLESQPVDIKLAEKAIEILEKQLPWFSATWKRQTPAVCSETLIALAVAFREEIPDLHNSLSQRSTPNPTPRSGWNSRTTTPRTARAKAGLLSREKELAVNVEVEKQLETLVNRLPASTESDFGKSTENLLETLEIPRLRVVTKALTEAARSFLVAIYTGIDGIGNEAQKSYPEEVVKASGQYHHQLLRIARICSDRKYASLLTCIEQPSLRERVTTAPTIGSVLPNPIDDGDMRNFQYESILESARRNIKDEGDRFHAINAQLISAIVSIPISADSIENNLVLELSTEILTILDTMKNVLNWTATFSYLYSLKDMVRHAQEDSVSPTSSADAINIWKSGETLPESEIGDLNMLFRQLTSSTGHDMEFTRAFLATYNSFTSPRLFFSKLVERYDMPSSMDSVSANALVLRVCVVLKNWILNQFDDFDELLIHDIFQFIDITLKKDKRITFSEQLHTILAEKAEGRYKKQTPLLESPSSLDKTVQLSPTCHMKEVLNNSPENIAAVFCKYDYEIFSKINFNELLNQAWTKKNKLYFSPNVLKLIGRVNQLSYWVASLILWQPGVVERTQLMSKIILIGKALRERNNFNSLMGILGGLNMACISRLKLTKMGLTPEIEKVFTELQNVMDPIKAWKNYRTAVRSVVPPCIPYLGVYLMDLTFIHDGNQDYLNGRINFQKHRLTFKALQHMEMYQTTAYPSNEDGEDLSNFLVHLPFLDEEQLWKLSQSRESRSVLAQLVG